MYKQNLVAGRQLPAAAVLALVMASAGCGGGGGGGTQTVDPPPPSSFPLGMAIANRVNNGYVVNNAVISGTINGKAATGTVTITESPAGAGSFEGYPALQQTYTATGKATTSAGPLNIASTSLVFYDTSYDVLGTTGSEYDVAPTPFAYPGNVKIGDTAILGSYNRYSDSTKSTLVGTVNVAYVVKADPTGNSTAIVDEIDYIKDNAGNNTSTSQTSFRIDAKGTYVFVSLSYQSTTGSGQQDLTYTAP